MDNNIVITMCHHYTGTTKEFRVYTYKQSCPGCTPDDPNYSVKVAFLMILLFFFICKNKVSPCFGIHFMSVIYFSFKIKEEGSRDIIPTEMRDTTFYIKDVMIKTTYPLMKKRVFANFCAELGLLNLLFFCDDESSRDLLYKNKREA